MIGVVAAAVEGLPGRVRFVAGGIGLGVAGAVIVAMAIGAISHFANGTGQELFGAAVLCAAGLMLAWNNIWMAEHGREFSARLKTLGADVVAGRASAAMILVVTALAVMREGSEIAMFLYGIAASGVKAVPLLTGSVLGLACGAAVGLVLFAGLSRVPLQRLFRISGAIILFIASGMLARGIAFLVQAGYLPPLVPQVWNSSALLSGSSILGRSLAALVGYTPAPSLMQVLVWIASFAAIGTLMLAKGGRFRIQRAGAAN